MVTSSLGTWLTLRAASSITDVYMASPTNPWISVAQFLPAVVIGTTIGTLFAAADASFHRQVGSEKEAAVRLIRNLLKSGIAVVVVLLLCQAPVLFLANQQAHRRYHAYSPDTTWLNAIGLLQPFLVFAALLWALQQTFKRS